MNRRLTLLALVSLAAAYATPHIEPVEVSPLAPRKSVRDFLIREGVDAGRLEARGFGEERPIVPDESPANMRKNRRTELTVIR